jgi:cell division protein ZapB
MTKDNQTQSSELELNQLEFRIEELIEVCNKLRGENVMLRKQQATLSQERSSLLEKNEHVKSRVEAMIGRLKSMEQNA